MKCLKANRSLNSEEKYVLNSKLSSIKFNAEDNSIICLAAAFG
jgi:hypothetical protein